jgi:glutathione synthase/RimK-type ligase-like ATP-grasp enzyme
MPARCAFLSMDNLAGYVCDDTLAIPPLDAAGWSVDTVSWRAADVAWETYDGVIIRSTWDYQDDPDAFLSALSHIEASGTRLLNPLSIVRWNLSKRYLADLERRGVPIVPTAWGDRLDEDRIASLFDAFDTPMLVIKPVVSANAKNTFLLRRGEPAASVAACFSKGAYLAQPFVPAIVDEGEYSLFFFDGAYSHTILKTPAPADFRVQEEHGGRIVPVEPEAALLRRSHDVLDAMNERLLYARVDLVRTPENDLALMELELIEPSLYFRMDAGAPARFAHALLRILDH